MVLNLLEVSTAGFRTTRDADQQCERLKNALGYKVNYLVARLAIARSLALPEAPPVEVKDNDDDDSGRTIRGTNYSGKALTRPPGSPCLFREQAIPI